MRIAARTTSRNRRALDPANWPVGPVINATCTLVTGKVQIEFDQAVSVSGLPAAITVQGIAPTSYVVNTQTRVTLTYAATVVAGNVCVIPSNLSEIRNRNGGYVVARTTTF